MPELPEVETIKRDLQDKIVGQVVSRIDIRDPKLGTGDNFACLKGKTLKSLDRKSKILIFDFDDHNSLMIHLKMTGQLVYSNSEELLAGGHSLDQSDLKKGIGGELPNKHTRAIICFESGDNLFFNDLRRFGYMKLLGPEEKKGKLEALGPEPLSKDFDPDSFRKILKKRKVAIKKLLLDQKVVSGLGNIYVDEVLFEARISPERLSCKISTQEAERLWSAIRKVLELGLRHRGTTFNNYVDGSGKKGNFSKFLKVYGREGESCPGCGGVVKKINLAGRGTHFCPACQK